MITKNKPENLTHHCFVAPAMRRLCDLHFIKIFLFLFIFLYASILSNAQTASVSLDKAQILLGQQVILQFKLDNVDNASQSVNQWFNIPDTGNHIEVISREKIDTVSINGQSTYIQKIIITSFDSGSWTIPVTAPVVDNQTIKTDSVSLQVLPVDVSKMQDFHPVRDILQVQYHDYTWLYISIGAIVLAIVIWLIIRWLKRRKPKQAKARSIIKGPPAQWALQQIDLLEKENLIQKGEGKLFFTKLDDICRTYFDERTNTHTLQSTSIEMMEKLRAFLIREKDRIALQEFAKLGDSVKFAKYHLQEEQGKDAIAVAKETIQNIEKQVVEREQKNAE